MSDVAGPAIEPVSINAMTIAQIDTLLEGIRMRRLSYVETLSKRTSLKGSVREQEYQIKFDAIANRIKKRLDKLDKDTDAIKLLTNKLRVLELECS